MSAITICKGATISAEEVARVELAMEGLIKDKGAAHELNVRVVLHNHNEYPKTLYRGKEIKVVDGEDAEAAAAKDGFGPYNHRSFTARRA